MRPQRWLAGKIESPLEPPRRQRPRKLSPSLATPRSSRRTCRTRLKDQLPRHAPAPEITSAGSRAAQPHRSALPPSATPSNFPLSRTANGMLQDALGPPPADPETTAGAAQRRAGSPPAAAAHKAAAAQVPRLPAAASPAHQPCGASNRVRIGTSIQRGADPVDKPGRQQRMPAQLKEAVVNPHPINPQHLGKKPAKDLLLRRPRRRTTDRPELRRRQRPTVELAVRRQRQGIQNDKRSTGPCSPADSRKPAAKSNESTEHFRPPQRHSPPDAR